MAEPARSPSRKPVLASFDEEEEGAADEHLAGDLATLGNSFIAFVGAGILDLPYAFSKVGLGLGTFIILSVAVVSLHCMYLLVDCKLLLERKGATVTTYGDVGEAAFGRWGRMVCDISLCLTHFGFCTAYVILISHSLDSVIAESPGFVPYIWLVVPGQLLLSTLRHLKFLGKFSLVADFTMTFALSTVFYYCFTQIAANNADAADGGASVDRLAANWPKAPFFFGVSIYCYEGIGMVIPIQSAMRNKDRFKFVWGVNMLLVTFLFWAVGFTGYLAYGYSVRESITNNLPTFDTLPSLVQLALCLGLYFTYPVMLFPVYQIIEKLLGRSAEVADLPSNMRRFAIICFSAFIASTVPSFSAFLGLVGSSTCALLALILPAAFSLKLQEVTPLNAAREGSVVVMGIIAAALGTQDALETIRNLP
eukprot:TRINITY_DN27367_c0_g1_i1.p1 TRINITY_DN27367_c0_g1~~TRINITY_DN27367_c0_g1_i1.p1  ORF type:complete len:439 (+),score=144.24 TRINITY_DN27367_c0_g1_i1:52-1317(+)